MGGFQQLRYWLLGILAALLCWGIHPAIAHLSPDAPPQAPTPAIAQTASSLDEQAQQAYTQQRYADAKSLFQQAEQAYAIEGDPIRQAIALSNLSLTHQRLGEWDAAQAALDRALALLQAAQQAPQAVYAQIRDVAGQLQLAQGNAEAAFLIWEETADLYAQLGDVQRQALSRLNQARALHAQGRFNPALRILETLAAEITSQPVDPSLKATVLRQLGDRFQATGAFDEAQTTLDQSLRIASDPDDVAAIKLSLGNLEQRRFQSTFAKQDTDQALQHAQTALSHYQEAARLSAAELGMQARLNVLRLLIHPGIAQWDTAAAFYPTIQSRLPCPPDLSARPCPAAQAGISPLPPGRTAIYSYVGLAEALMALKDRGQQATPTWEAIADLLVPAQIYAEASGDRLSQSWVLGTLGHLDEKMGQWDTAADLSRQALTLALDAQAEDIGYRWLWQLGRVLEAEARYEDAIDAYTSAYRMLEGIRRDLISVNSDMQFSFQEQVEPLYRELVDLLVSSVPDLQASAQTKAHQADHQERLRLAREVMESFQIAQLENFFQAACIDEPTNVDQLLGEQQQSAAVVYTILLKDLIANQDRLEVVLTLPTGETAQPKNSLDDSSAPEQTRLVHYATPASRATDVQATLREFRAALTRGETVQQYGQQLYDWMLRPAVDQGLLDGIDTLIFVLDGDLRLIPMATLYDGETFLVEKYALSLLLGLEVRDPRPLPPRPQLATLVAGLTDPPALEGRNYAALPNVNTELDRIAATELPTTFLRDAAFTKEALERQLNTTDYNIVHLATHGEFGRDRQDTFILSADTPIDLNTLGEVFRSRRQEDTNLEMLILSACKTATGDSREVLGIAGAAVQAGARSAIATLWSVDDAASVLFTEALYENLGKPDFSRAQALQQAQIALLRRYPGRPRYWAPYILVGSWR